MKMTKLAPVSLAMFYGANRDFANAFSVRVTLKNPIEPEALRRAVDKAMERYPYFAVRLAVQGEALVLEDNPLPVTIVKGPEPAKLNTAASNYHLVGVSYERTSVIFGAFHALTDGAGAFHWIKTTLYYYLCETEGRELDPAGVRLAGEEIPEGELEDPFNTEIPETEEPMLPKWSGAFSVTDHTPVGRQRCWHIRIGETSFMKYTRTQDGSPATITSAFMAKTLHTLYPDMTEPVVCGMAHNIRDVIHKPLAHQSMVKLIELSYPPRLKGSDIERLAICSRGMVMLQSQPETVWDTVKKQLALEKELEGLSLQEKFDLLRPVVTGARTGIGNLPASAPVSFKVSYVGRTDWGSMANMIESVHCSVTTDGSGICIEINTCNGYFDYCFMQEFEDDKYVNTFVDLLEQEGIYCTVSGPYDVHVPKMRLPDDPEE